MRKTAIAMAALLLIVGACATDGGSDTTSGGSGTTVAGGDGTTVGGGDGGVSVASSDLGDILVDPEGFTLYVFTNDTDGVSTCYEGCASTWPAVPADTPIGSGLDSGMFGSADRTDGSPQLTVNGQPLYRYAPDTAPGDTNGQGVGGVWFAVGADGEMIEG